MRTPRLLAQLLAALTLVACAREPPRSHALDDLPPLARGPRAAEVPGPAPTVDLKGIVSTRRGVGVDGADVLVVDAGGARQVSRTSDDGSFAFRDVAVPYDILVATDGAAPSALFGLRRADPWIEVRAREASVVALAPQVVRVTVTPPPFAARPAWFSVVTSAPSTRGGATRQTERIDREPVTVEIAHAWYERPDPGEPLQVNVLAGDERRSAFAFGAVRVDALPGDRTEAGLVVLEATRTTAPFVVGTEGGGVGLEDWLWSTEASIDLEGGAPIPFALAAGPSVTTRAPLLAGSPLRVRVTAHDPHGEDGRGFGRSTEAWSGPCAAPSAGVAGPSRLPLTVDVPPILEAVEPVVEGTVSARDVELAWGSGGEAALVDVVVADTRRGGVRFRALSAGQRLSHARLDALGLGRLLPGEHVLELTATPSFTVDEATSGDAAVRRARFGRDDAGAAAHLRVPFRVVP